MKYEVTWVSKDDNPRCEKITFVVNARTKDEALQITMDFLGVQTGAPVWALWKCETPVQI